MIFAIRDDDTSFFTKPEELDFVYKEIIENMPISLSVVPFSVSTHADRVIASMDYKEKEFPIGDNLPLKKYISDYLKQDKVEIILHGYSHKYKLINGRWIPECRWKSYQELLSDIGKGKQYLENLFNINISTFAAPSNCIGPYALRVIEKYNMNLSGLSNKSYECIPEMKYLFYRLKRINYAMLHKHQYPYVMNYKEHKELCIYWLSIHTQYDQLLEKLLYAKKINANFVLQTHYWTIYNNRELKNILLKIADKAVELGFSPGKV